MKATAPVPVCRCGVIQRERESGRQRFARRESTAVPEDLIVREMENARGEHAF